MNTATRVRTVAWDTDSALYRLDPPVAVDDEQHEYVVVSALVPVNGAHGCVALTATHEGEVTSWDPFARSESAEHADLLKDLGYEVKT